MAQTAEGDRRVVMALLRRIDRKGDTGAYAQWAIETLQFGDYIRVCGPRAGVNPYNGYCLTERGREMLNT